MYLRVILVTAAASAAVAAAVPHRISIDTTTALVILVTAAASAAVAAAVPHRISIDTTTALARTSGHYTCWNIDASSNRGFFQRNLSPSKPLGAQLARQARAISIGQSDGHSLLRFGGGGNDMLLYEMDPAVTHCPPPNAPTAHCLNATTLTSLLDFARAAQAKIIFGIAQPKWLPKVNATTPFVPWVPNNARAMLKWIIGRDDDDLLYALELGNEVDGFNSGAQQAVNLQILHDLTVELWPAPASRRPLLLGPDAAHQNSTRPHKPSSRDAYVGDFLAAAAQNKLPIHGATLHKYISVTSAQDTDGLRLDETTARLTSYAATVADGWSRGGGTEADAPRPWCGECGPHTGGCVEAEGPTCRECDHTSMRWATFGDSLWYVDALASAARLSYETFCRQDYIGIDYGLVDCATGLPLPDYWSAVVWSRLTGDVVLNAISLNSSGTRSETLRAYAHCAAMGTTPSAVAEPGSVTLVVINLGSTTVEAGVDITAGASLGGGGDGAAWVATSSSVATLYQLTPRNEPGSGLTNATGLNGTGVALNGAPLILTAGGAVPDVGLLGVNQSASEPLELPPTSITFVVLHGAASALCEGRRSPELRR